LISSQKVLGPLPYRHIHFNLFKSFGPLHLFEENINSNPLMGPRIETLEISLPLSGSYTIKQLQRIQAHVENILPLTTSLRELRISGSIFHAVSPYIMDMILPSLAHTLVLLHTQYHKYKMQYASSISQLRKLRSLQLENIDVYDVDWSAVRPFDLPELEEIKWFGSRRCDWGTDPLNFLVRCHLPALRALHLVMVLGGEPGMAEILGKFLHKHPSVDHVGLAMEGDYALLKSVEVKHIDLSWCNSNFDVGLLDHLPSTARVLSLPVHLNGDEEAHADLYTALAHLLAVKTGILEVRLFARCATAPMHSTEDERGLCFRDHRDNGPYTPLAHIFGILQYYAQRLETERQIVLRDDHLMSFKDHGM
jgi:hypothetical protein